VLFSLIREKIPHHWLKLKIRQYLMTRAIDVNGFTAQ